MIKSLLFHVVMRGVPWDKFKSEIIETLYLVSALKEPVQLWNKHEYQHSGDTVVKNIFNSFHDTLLLLYSRK